MNSGIPPTAEWPGSTSSSLIARVKMRDQVAWQRFVKLYHPLILHWCRESGLPAEDCADVIQEVFRSVSAGIDDLRLDRQGDSFRGWLRTITRSRIVDHIRRICDQAKAAGGTDAQRHLLSLADPQVSDADNDSTPAESQVVFRSALELIRAEFETTTWNAFWRVTVEEQNPADTAADLGISRNAVYKAKSRVLRRLREELDQPPQ